MLMTLVVQELSLIGLGTSVLIKVMQELKAVRKAPTAESVLPQALSA
jgi:hypothetical protein